jgi:hypothetical protein
MKTIYQTSQERKNVLSSSADEPLRKNSRGQENNLNKTYPEYDSQKQTTDSNGMVCDLGI